MRLLRGPYFLVAGILAVAIGVVVGVMWLPRAQPVPEPVPYHRQAAIIRELEPVFERMDKALVKALAPFNPVCDRPDDACTIRSDPGTFHGPAFGAFSSARRAGNFKNIRLNVSREAGKAARFDLAMSFAPADGVLVMSAGEKQTVFEIARGYGFGESGQAAILEACKETPGSINSTKIVTAGDVRFSCQVAPQLGRFYMSFNGPPPSAFAAPR